MYKINISDKGLKELADLENGHDISAGRDYLVEKIDGFVCDQCRVLTLYKDYFRINSNDFCSLQCYEIYRLRPAVIPKVKKVVKKKKGKKKK